MKGRKQLTYVSISIVRAQALGVFSSRSFVQTLSSRKSCCCPQLRDTTIIFPLCPEVLLHLPFCLLRERFKDHLSVVL
jgi:hypothetical protein